MRAPILIAILLLGCGCGTEPRWSEAALSGGAPRANLSGTTFGEAAALELAPGCPGYLDVETPGHVVHVQENVPFTIQVSSPAGPLALAVASGDEVRCDSDQGSGHAPSLSFEGEGDYQVFVAALRAPAELSYEVELRAGDAQGEASLLGASQRESRDVSVTITSDPAGAQVRDGQGSVIGTTPAMFVVAASPEEIGQPRSWILALPGHRETTVTGQLAAGALVLHGQLPTLGPTNIDVTADESQPIRDLRSATLAIDVAEACAITEAEVAVDIRHTYIGDLRVILRAPWGDELELHRHAGRGRRNLRRSWDTDESRLSPLLGHNTRGRWTLIVHDDAGADQGSFERFDLHLTCAPQVSQAVAAPSNAVAVAVSPPRSVPQRPHRPRPPRTGTTARPQVPDLPTRADIVRVLGALRSRVERCGTSTQTSNVRVIATVTGSTGRVTEVSSTGSASDSERQCVQRIVRTARFGRFRRQSLDVDYTYALAAAPSSAPQGGQPPIL